MLFNSSSAAMAAVKCSHSTPFILGLPDSLQYNGISQCNILTVCLYFPQVLERVMGGFRLPPPPGCPYNIYKLMIDCWYMTIAFIHSLFKSITL